MTPKYLKYATGTFLLLFLAAIQVIISYPQHLNFNDFKSGLLIGLFLGGILLIGTIGGISYLPRKSFSAYVYGSITACILFTATHIFTFEEPNLDNNSNPVEVLEYFTKTDKDKALQIFDTLMEKYTAVYQAKLPLAINQHERTIYVNYSNKKLISHRTTSASYLNNNGVNAGNIHLLFRDNSALSSYTRSIQCKDQVLKFGVDRLNIVLETEFYIEGSNKHIGSVTTNNCSNI